MRVVIIDDRPNWQKKEDEQYLCQIKCKYFKKCISRFGTQCVQLNGDTIPKMK